MILPVVNADLFLKNLPVQTKQKHPNAQNADQKIQAEISVAQAL